MEDIGKLLLRIWFADAPLDVTEAEYSTLAACFDGGTWGNWQLDPLSPSEDWPDGLAYLINRLEAEADTITTPGDAWRQCHARFISLKQRRLAASLEPELAAELVIETDSNSAKPLRKREQTVLRILSQHGPELMTSAEISQHSESGEHGEAMAERTSTQAAKDLVDADLAERPMGLKEGLRLTKAGRARAKNLPAVRK
jgi:hypothetical protein